ncbi:MAG TPA: hypothetical protein ENI85_04320, partial [Deltaproteobacteria bacterium]|nr:hypothetical protein [Deltaproteobacteria bacterium]
MPREGPMSGTPRIGEILVEAGVIDEMQLAAALGEQARWGRRLGVTLIKMGMVEEGHLVRALAKQLDLPVASLAGKRIADDVIALVPAKVATEHGVVPLFVKREGRTSQLYLGMEDPSNLAVLDDLSFRTGMEVHPVMVGPTELGQAIDRYYLGSGAAGAEADAGSTSIGEQNLRTIREGSETPTPEVPARPAPPVPLQDDPGRAAGDADSSTGPPIELNQTVETAPLPEGLVDDVARALEET